MALTRMASNIGGPNWNSIHCTSTPSGLSSVSRLRFCFAASRIGSPFWKPTRNVFPGAAMARVAALPMANPDSVASNVRRLIIRIAPIVP